MMNKENPSAVSPFSALSYQEQQDRWLEWRSRQLDYRPVSESGQALEAPAAAPQQASLPPMRLPNMRIQAPSRHRELDQVLIRHRQALRQAGTFQPTVSG